MIDEALRDPPTTSEISFWDLPLRASDLGYVLAANEWTLLVYDNTVCLQRASLQIYQSF